MGIWSFRFLGFPVVVEPWFWIVMLVMGARRPPEFLLSWMLAAFVSVLAHELGHAYMGRAYGLDSSIRLHGLGGLTFYERGRRPLALWHRALLSLAGPMAGFAFALLVYAVEQTVPFEGRFLRVLIADLLYVNIAWSLINLLPILPLDGGNVLRQAVYGWTGSDDDTLPLRVSVAVGAAASVTALLYDSLLTAALFGFMAYENYTALQRRPPGKVYR